MSDPILNSTLFDQAIDFSQFTAKDLAISLKQNFQKALKQRDQLIAPQTEVNWDNTMAALESCGEDLERILSVVYNFFSANTSDDIQKLVEEYSPLLSEYSNSITLSDEVFKRVKFLFENQQNINLIAEQKQLLKKSYEDFVRNGALLSPEKKDELKKIDRDLSELSPKFSKNVLDATNAFVLTLSREDLEGLPESAIEAAAAEAESRGLQGQYVVTLDFPSYSPYMKYAKNREIRQKLFTAMAHRAYKDQYDNQEIIKNMVSLRMKKAQILGFKDYAEFILSNRMAETPQKVFDFLSKLNEVALPKAKEEIKEIAEFAKETDQIEMQEWDFSYYAEKFKQKKFNFDAEELRPYFKLENVLQGAFDHAEKLYGIAFYKREDLPVYHSDVTVYEVREAKSQNYVGLFYADFFPRATKRGGAWMTSYRDQGMWGGEVKRPHISIVCNFTKPTPTKPSLLTFIEVQTLFHEFGHSLHGLLSNCQYRSLGGTNVLWDFVELPSQIMENWTLEKESLHLFARHYETGELIPDELIQKLQASENFLNAYACVRQFNFAYMDMIWHTQPDLSFSDINDYEKSILKDSLLFKSHSGSSSCAFSHIFAGGYAAGYYSYKWAEVLDADAFEFFKEKGIFNPEVAQAFKDNILSKGSTEHPMELYKKFRGREPDVSALLRRDGLI